MKLMKMEMIIKELKQRLADSKVNVFSEKGKEYNEVAAVMSKVYTGCIIQTKPYYISPFLEVID